MNIQEALKTHKYVQRPHWEEDQGFCYHEAGTGPYKDLVSCDYFTFLELGYLSFSTSGPDLYAEDFLANDYILMKNAEDQLSKAIKD